MYPIACSLYALNHESILDVQQDILSTMNHSDESSQGWSLWSSQATTSNGSDPDVLSTGVSHGVPHCTYLIDIDTWTRC